MAKNLLHSLIGSGQSNSNLAAMNALTPGAVHSVTNTQASLLEAVAKQHIVGRSKRVFHGKIEVLQVSNGYVVNITTREGYEYESHIAQNITEVNEIIAAQIVAFKLEDRS